MHCDGQILRSKRKCQDKIDKLKDVVSLKSLRPLKKFDVPG